MRPRIGRPLSSLAASLTDDMEDDVAKLA